MYDLTKLATARRNTARQKLLSLDYPLSQIEDTLPHLEDCESYQAFVNEINDILKELSEVSV